uniref:Peptidyl-prolyl cis-trans isomerase n=1 Tax=Scylla olivacea TaxID=85551 RepID=A0A0P4WJ64_SCYOL
MPNATTHILITQGPKKQTKQNVAATRVCVKSFVSTLFLSCYDLLWVLLRNLSPRAHPTNPATAKNCKDASLPMRSGKERCVIKPQDKEGSFGSEKVTTVMSVVIETTIGDITIDLHTEARPRTCMNFLKLCKMKYYNFCLMFSIQRNFIAQTGDPSASGKGGESIFQKMYGDQARFYEGEKLPIMKHSQLGTVSMVSCGNHLFGSQFFITLGEDLDSLDSEHLVFGQVVEGLEVINRLNQTLTDEKYRPYQDVRISHTVVLDDPYPDPKDLHFPAESPKPTPAVFESDYIAADEAIDDTEGKSLTEIQEEIQEKEAKARATILEMVGDLPDAEMAPPENVLFVCKLNPVTTSEDLEIIFSRFGKINTCEVIRDRVTNNSLQYAFIEFAETKSCEDAYFKMDNVLIDDRRIHVDFSQSVSKIRWRGKGRGVEYFDDDGKKMDERKGRERFQPNQEHNSNSHSRGRHKRPSQGHQPQGRRMYGTEHRNFHADRRHSHQEPDDQNGSHRSHFNERHSQRNESFARRTERDERHERHNSNKQDYGDLEEEIAMKDDASREKMLKHLKKSLKKKKKKSKKHSSDSASSAEDRKKKNKRKRNLSDSDSSMEEVKKKKKKKMRKK